MRKLPISPPLRPGDRCRASQRGLSLVEVSVTMVLLILTLGPAMQSFLTTMDAQNALAGTEELEEKVRRAGEELRHELGKAGFSTLVNLTEAPETVRGFRYQPLEGFDPTTGPAWGSEVTITSARGQVIRFMDGRARSLASGLTDVQFAREGRVLKIYLLAAGPGSAESRITVRRTVDVALQN